MSGSVGIEANLRAPCVTAGHESVSILRTRLTRCGLRGQYGMDVVLEAPAMRLALTGLALVVLATPTLASDGVLEINQTCAVQTG